MAGEDPAEYVGQLHKSLFDTKEVDRLLSEASFPSYVIFSYVYPGEPVAVPLSSPAVPLSRLDSPRHYPANSAQTALLPTHPACS